MNQDLTEFSSPLIARRDESVEQEAVAKEAEAGPAVHLTLDQFRLGVDAFNPMVVERKGEPVNTPAGSSPPQTAVILPWCHPRG
ncbi:MULTISPECIES: hypothetical protein [unclassified Streptomyces]|uniref:hypothetical protein n=1 Tax=unclassified Streptomyces TaxID=2593676 RepID=UPI0016204D9C|nr:hypothetical protein [Streptomyces sp. I6]